MTRVTEHPALLLILASYYLPGIKSSIRVIPPRSFPANCQTKDRVCVQVRALLGALIGGPSRVTVVYVALQTMWSC